MEALEVHYRIHACILKYLEQHEGKPLKKSLGQVFMDHLLDCANSPFMQYESKLNRIKRTGSNGYPEVAQSENTTTEMPKSRTNQEKRSNSVEEIPAPEKIETTSKASKSELRKRHADTQQDDNRKRIKLGSVSHLQLMQDVVGLMEDLITNVCEIAANRESSGDEITILSSDESEKAQKITMKEEVRRKEPDRSAQEDRASINVEKKMLNSPLEKAENVQDLMDELMKRTMELSDERQTSPPDDEETRKSDGKWLINDEAHTPEARFFIGKERDKESKEKNSDRKKSHINSVKDEGTLSRRGSQESTTTTQTTTTNTETNNSSSSSSDESSSSEDSSESDSSSSSDSESAESETEKKRLIPELGEKGKI